MASLSSDRDRAEAAARARWPRRIAWCLALSAVALVSLSIPLRIPAQTYGNTLVATFLLFVGLAIELFRLRRAGRNVLSGRPERCTDHALRLIADAKIDSADVLAHDAEQQ
jgi:hypothetical protein